MNERILLYLSHNKKTALILILNVIILMTPIIMYFFLMDSVQTQTDLKYGKTNPTVFVSNYGTDENGESKAINKEDIEAQICEEKIVVKCSFTVTDYFRLEDTKNAQYIKTDELKSSRVANTDAKEILLNQVATVTGLESVNDYEQPVILSDTVEVSFSTDFSKQEVTDSEDIIIVSDRYLQQNNKQVGDQVEFVYEYMDFDLGISDKMEETYKTFTIVGVYSITNADLLFEELKDEMYEDARSYNPDFAQRTEEVEKELEYFANETLSTNYSQIFMEYDALQRYREQARTATLNKYPDTRKSVFDNFTIKAEVRDSKDMKIISEKFVDVFSDNGRYAFAPSIVQEDIVVKEQKNLAGRILEVDKKVFIVTGIIAIIINIVLFLRRQNEYGLILQYGISKTRVYIQIYLENLYVTLFGSAVGFVIAFGVLSNYKWIGSLWYQIRYPNYEVFDTYNDMTYRITMSDFSMRSFLFLVAVLLIYNFIATLGSAIILSQTHQDELLDGLKF